MPKPTRIIVSCDSKFYRGRPVNVKKTCIVFTSAATISASYGSHVALSQHPLSSLFRCVKWPSVGRRISEHCNRGCISPRIAIQSVSPVVIRYWSANQKKIFKKSAFVCHKRLCSLLFLQLFTRLRFCRKPESNKIERVILKTLFLSRSRNKGRRKAARYSSRKAVRTCETK